MVDFGPTTRYKNKHQLPQGLAAFPDDDCSINENHIRLEAGHNRFEIAQELKLAPREIRAHFNTIGYKLIARDLGLLSLPPPQSPPMAQPEPVTISIIRPEPAAIHIQPKAIALTAIETAVLELLPGYPSRSQIAGQLNLSISQIHFALFSLYKKLGVHDQVAAVRCARKLKLIPDYYRWQ